MFLKLHFGEQFVLFAMPRKVFTSLANKCPRIVYWIASPWVFGKRFSSKQGMGRVFTLLADGSVIRVFHKVFCELTSKRVVPVATP